MKRSRFIKYISLGAIFSPNLLFHAKSSNIHAKSSLQGYRLIDQLENYNLTDDDVDDFLLKKIKGEYYLIQATTLDIREFGAKGDGQTDDFIAIQNAFDNCVKFRKTLYVSRPEKSYLSSKSILIKGQIKVFGDGLALCGFNFLNCNGFEIREGVTNVTFEKITINQASRYTNKVNNFVAFNFLGSESKRSYTNIFRDIFIDGFQTAFKLAWIWDSLFSNIKVVYCKIGFDIIGTSVNNIISDSSISVSGAGSRAIFFSDRISPTEGWRITNLLTVDAEIAIHAYYTSNIYVTTPILDFCSLRAIKLDDGIGPSTNWQVLGGYIAMCQNSEAAIEVVTQIDNKQIRGNKFSDLDILAYKGSLISQAFKLKGDYSKSQINNVTITNTKILK
ncbi:hypothetical protein BAS09_16740 [Elizabethkingia ursingii]|uniref:glycosyl hydrolase family 28-related protein n=1 Tax=Elizabethkingia ursingii TaxID=1756150 RepID=UPI00099A63CD|nr:glycosyl hydrolase family 28-related protein [Elizabethkingia ursingii]OPC00331.1 hypothetical protein BAS09_16740 [Elizabethkingia ursingii]